MIESISGNWATALPSLLACVAVTDGPVLELGAGYFSTVTLHSICAAQNRPLVTVEDDIGWHNRFTGYISDTHELLHAPNYDIALASLEKRNWQWSVGYVDESPGGERRRKSFEWMIQRCGFVVLHDAQRGAENFAAVEHLLPGLKWKLCDRFFPATLVASATRELPEGLL